MDFKDEIKTKLFTSTGKVSAMRVKQHRDLFNKICELTNFLPQNAVFSERIYCVLNDIKKPVLCPVSSLPVKWSPQRKEYRTVVGKHNVNKVGDKTESVKQFKETISKKHENIRNNIWAIYNQGKFTLLEKETLKNLCKTKIKERTSTYFKITKLLEQKDIVCSLIKYTDNGFLKGVQSFNWSERIYLVVNDMNEPPACLDNPSKKQFFENAIKGYRKFSSNKKRTIDYTYKNIIPSIELQGFTLLTELSGNLYQEEHTLRCNRCNNTHKRRLYCGIWQNVYCEHCYGKVGKSKEEQELCDFIKTHTTQEVLQQFNYSGDHNKEIDIFIPSKKIGFEYNGFLWHSYGTDYPNNISCFHKKYHIQQKQKEAAKEGIQIYNIFDYEWINKKEIVKSLVKSKLDTYDEKIYAKDCIVEEIPLDVCNMFLLDNHLKGSTDSTYRLGLKYNNTLVSVIAFKDRHISNNKPSVELVRFCNKLNTIVIDGASKLFDTFIKTYNPLNIIKYDDKRFSNGELYTNLGFKLIRETNPNYVYIKNYNIEPRIKYQKHKLSHLLETFDPSKTEIQNMWNNKYRVLYDCGNYVFKWCQS